MRSKHRATGHKMALCLCYRTTPIRSVRPPCTKVFEPVAEVVR